MTSLHYLTYSLLFVQVTDTEGNGMHGLCPYALVETGVGEVGCDDLSRLG